MIRRNLVWLALVCVASFSGCGQSLDGMIDDLIDCMDDMAAAVEKEDPEAEIRAQFERMAGIARRWDSNSASAHKKNAAVFAAREKIREADDRLREAAEKHDRVQTIRDVLKSMPASKRPQSSRGLPVPRL